MPAQTFHHLPNHMVGPDSDPIAQQLHRQMPISQMPGYPNQLGIVMRVDFHQVFRLRTDTNNTRIRQQAIAIPQADSLRQVDQHLRPQQCRQNDTAAEPAVIVDQDPIGFARCRPTTRRQDLADGDQNRKYRCAIGRIVAGSHVSSTPSALTS